MIATSEIELPDACGMQVSNYRVSATGTTGVARCVDSKSRQDMNSIKMIEKDVQQVPNTSRPNCSRELLKTCLACVQTGSNLSDGSKHSNPSVVDFTSSHLIRVVIKPRQRVAEVARLLALILHEDGCFKGGDDCNHQDEASLAIANSCCTRILWHALEAIPRAPIIAKRPCLISLARRSLKVASSLQKSKGSKNPTGSMAPIWDSLLKLHTTFLRAIGFLALAKLNTAAPADAAARAE